MAKISFKQNYVEVEFKLLFKSCFFDEGMGLED